MRGLTTLAVLWCVSIPVQAQAPVLVVVDNDLQDGSSECNVGDTKLREITIRNNGTTAASHFTLTIAHGTRVTVDPGKIFVSASNPIGQRVYPDCTNVGTGIIKCRFPDSLPPGNDSFDTPYFVTVREEVRIDSCDGESKYDDSTPSVSWACNSTTCDSRTTVAEGEVPPGLPKHGFTNRGTPESCFGNPGCSPREVGIENTAAARALDVHADPIDFSDPADAHRPFIRWWWPGGDVSDAELTRELQVIRDAGFGGVELQSFAVGLPAGGPAEVATYGTPEWYGHVEHVLSEASANGLLVDLTLGSAWPTGGDHLTDAQSSKQLQYSRVVVNGPSEIDLPIPAPWRPFYHTLGEALLLLDPEFDPEKMTLIGLLGLRLDADQTQERPQAESTIPGFPALPPTVYLDPSTVTDLNPYVTGDGTIEWNVPEGTWNIFAFYAGPTGTRPFYGAEPGGGRVLDHLSRTALDAHMQAIGNDIVQRLSPHLGAALRGLFVDSLELRAELLWTDDFLSQFAMRRGYGVQPFMPLLFVPLRHDPYLDGIWPEANPVFEYRGLGDRVREDYEQTVSELITERFIQPLTDWSHSRNLVTRFQGFGSPGDVLDLSGAADIPETEGLFAGGKRSFLKLASSAAHIHDRRLVGGEVLSIPDRPLMTTPARILGEANRQFAAGVNQLVLHGYTYVYDTPHFIGTGWYPWCSVYLPRWDAIGSFASTLNERNPFWSVMPELTRYLSRAQAVLQSGVSVADVAVYIDAKSYPDDSAPEPAALTELEAFGFTYDYLNRAALLSNSAAVDARLQISNQSYKAIVVPDADAIPHDVAAKLLDLKQAGVPVVFVGALPQRSTGFFDAQARDAIVDSSLEQIFGNDPDAVARSERYAAENALFLADARDTAAGMSRELGLEPDVFLASAMQKLRYTHRRVDDSDYYFFTNVSDRALGTFVYFEDTVRVPELLDPKTGQIRTAPVYEPWMGRLAVWLDLEPGAAIFVRFARAGSALHVENTTLADVLRNEQGELVGRARVPGTYEVRYGQGVESEIQVGPVDSALPPIDLGPWHLAVDSEDLQGNPISLQFDLTTLQDWRDIPDLQFVSGVGTYTTSVVLPPEYLAGDVQLQLDLGTVHDLASVTVNGASQDALFTAPFRLDVSDLLVAGRNDIKVELTTTARNRFVGYGLAGLQYYAPLVENPELSPSGLVGPVRIEPLYESVLDGSAGVGGSGPLPFGISLVPPFTTVPTFDGVIDAMHKARTLTNTVALTILWRDPVFGGVQTCDDAREALQEAKRLGMRTLVMFQTFHVGEVSVPDEYVPASFSNPDVRRDYLQQIACLAELQPDYMVLGPELNLAYEFNRAEFDAFKPVYANAYALAKSLSPETQTGLSFHYPLLESAGDWRPVLEMWPQDHVGLTAYFAETEAHYQRMPTPEDVPDDFFGAARSILPPEVPVIVVETGWSSFYSPTGDHDQARFVEHLGRLTGVLNPELVIWNSQHDIDQYSGFLEGLNELGLWDFDGTETPAVQATEQGMRDGELSPAGALHHHRVFAGSMCAYSGDRGRDCNANSIIDRCDVYAGLSVDDDGNLIPDECEP